MTDKRTESEPADLDDLASYSYELPDHLIAREPVAQRDASRLLVLDRATRSLSHRTTGDLPELLEPGDCLVLNNTRVVPARLVGKRTATGGRWEGLFLATDGEGQWKLIGQTRGRLRSREQITIESVHQPDRPTLPLTLISRDEEGTWTARAESDVDAFELLQQYGTVPLPPYMQQPIARDQDWERYQTVYAVEPGSVAAPTAGLHFTPELLDRCRQRGIGTASVTLHVGIGTFRPVSADRLSEHRMHSEWCELDSTCAKQLRETRAGKRRVVAVGTTSVRTLETAASGGTIQAWQGSTDLFIRPPHEFQSVDALLTNFHLPRSTLLVLVSAFAGIDFIREAYQTAIREEYRFYSYGDAMLIL